MAALALALLVVYVALAFGARALAQLRRTGSTGFKGISGRPGSAEWLGGALFVAGAGLVLAAPVLALAGTLEPAAPWTGRSAARSGSPSTRWASPGHWSRRAQWGTRGASAWTPRRRRTS